MEKGKKNIEKRKAVRARVGGNLRFDDIHYF